MDLRLDEFELPEMQDDEIMAEVITDSLCMSSYKAITQAQKHKKYQMISVKIRSF